MCKVRALLIDVRLYTEVTVMHSLIMFLITRDRLSYKYYNHNQNNNQLILPKEVINVMFLYQHLFLKLYFTWDTHTPPRVYSSVSIKGLYIIDKLWYKMLLSH